MRYERERKVIESALSVIENEFLSKERRAEAKNHSKGLKDVVTDLDLAIEKYLLGVLKENFPTDVVISEEFNPENHASGRTWTIDPIDGTINFSMGSVVFGCQIALMEGLKPVLSYVMLPDMAMTFMAVDGEGAYLNGERFFVDKNVTVERAVISLGGFSNKDEELSNYEHDIVKLMQKGVMSIRLFGAGSYDTVGAACGIVNSHFMFAQHVWDVAPGYLVCKEAGCIITKVDGSPVEIGFPSYHFSANQEITDFVAACAKKLEASKKYH